MAKKVEETVAATVIEEEKSEAPAVKPNFFDKITDMSNVNVALLIGFCVVVLMLLVTIASGPAGTPAEASTQVATTAPVPAPSRAAAFIGGGEAIERKGEGRLFYTTIKIPPGAETLYLSGSGAKPKPDGSWGSMEEQAIDTFTSFKQKLEAEGWGLADIVQVRAFAKAGEFGLLDFDGFNRGYSQFFGTDENPNKPVRSFVQIADLVNPGWLVEIEIRAARMP
jgi:enamine deaminase RidA (YjgF/YER057c/UK114 family)